jgi:hypothetical protein
MGMNFHKLLKRNSAVLSGKSLPSSPSSSRTSSAASTPLSEFPESDFLSDRSSLSSDIQFPPQLDPIRSLAIAEAVSVALKLRFPGLDDFDDAFTRIAGGIPPELHLPSYKEYYGTARLAYMLNG